MDPSLPEGTGSSAPGFYYDNDNVGICVHFESIITWASTRFSRKPSFAFFPMVPDHHGTKHRKEGLHLQEGVQENRGRGCLGRAVLHFLPGNTMMGRRHSSRGTLGFSWEVPNRIVQELGGGFTITPTNTQVAAVEIRQAKCSKQLPHGWLQLKSFLSHLGKGAQYKRQGVTLL